MSIYKNSYFPDLVKLTKEKRWKTKDNDFIPDYFYMLTSCFIKFSVDSIGFPRKTII